MDASILVATATYPFGMLIQQTLEASGRYSVTFVDTGRAALDAAARTRFAICIVDSDLPDKSLEEVAWGIREMLAGVRLVLVPPNNEKENPAAAALNPDGYLTKPFYLPALLDSIDGIMEKARPPEAAPAPAPSQGSYLSDYPARPAPKVEIPLWLQDVSRAAQHLTRLSLESAAQAALIVHNGELWAYAGELSQPAGQELAGIVAAYWGRDGVSDLARFVRLKSVGGEYMLYATGLAGGMVLALVFDVETPFSKIRSQVGRLAKALAIPPGSEPEAPPPLKKKQQPDFDDDDPGDIPPMPPLFDDVPPPNPEGFGKSTGGPRLKPAPVQIPFVDDFEFGAVEEPAISGAPSASLKIDPPSAEIIPPLEMPVDVETLEPPAAPQETRRGDWIPDPWSSDPMAETRPHIFEQDRPDYVAPQAAPEITPEIDPDPVKVPDLQPASMAVCDLRYACLLLPRLPKHHLTGELASGISDWMASLCLAFGWRLEHLSIRPDYMQWIINVPPSTSPSYLMRVIRQHTSQRIFSQYPDFARENPSGDFWAPGYLIMSSPQPLPAQIVQDFIRQTRHRQGASRPIPRHP